jgi:hypothetical protein
MILTPADVSKREVKAYATESRIQRRLFVTTDEYSLDSAFN